MREKIDDVSLAMIGGTISAGVLALAVAFAPKIGETIDPIMKNFHSNYTVHAFHTRHVDEDGDGNPDYTLIQSSMRGARLRVPYREKMQNQ